MNTCESTVKSAITASFLKIGAKYSALHVNKKE